MRSICLASSLGKHQSRSGAEVDSIMTISDYLTPREEVSEGQFQGVLQAHKVGDDETRLENDADRLFSLTYPSNALQTFDHVDNKLRGQDSQGGIALSGPYRVW